MWDREALEEPGPALGEPMVNRETLERAVNRRWTAARLSESNTEGIGRTELNQGRIAD